MARAECIPNGVLVRIFHALTSFSSQSSGVGPFFQAADRAGVTTNMASLTMGPFVGRHTDQDGDFVQPNGSFANGVMDDADTVAAMRQSRCSGRAFMGIILFAYQHIMGLFPKAIHLLLSLNAENCCRDRNRLIESDCISPTHKFNDNTNMVYGRSWAMIQVMGGEQRSHAAARGRKLSRLNDVIGLSGWITTASCAAMQMDWVQALAFSRKLHGNRVALMEDRGTDRTGAR